MLIRSKLVLNAATGVVINAILVSTVIFGLVRIRAKVGELRNPFQNEISNQERAAQTVVAALYRASAEASGNAETADRQALLQLEESSRLLTDLDSKIRRLRQLEFAEPAGEELKSVESVAAAAGSLKQLLVSDSGAYSNMKRNIETSSQARQANRQLLGEISANAEHSRTRLASAYNEQETILRSIEGLVRETALACLILGLGAALLALIYRIGMFFGIMRSLRDFSVIAERLSAGDFTARVDQHRENEFGHLARRLNQTAMGLGTLMDQLAGFSGNLSHSTSRLSATAGGIHEGTAMVLNMVERSALNASRTKEKMKSAREFATTADAFLTELAASSKATTEAGNAAGRLLRTLEEIAFKTNLLSLNAAVEAARSGAAGAGFEVVAGAVRSLSLQSSEAARSTAKLFGEIVGNTSRGVEIAEKLRIALKQTAGLSKDVVALIDEMASCSRSQDSQMKKLNQGTSALREISVQSAAVATEISSTVNRYRRSAKARKKAAKASPLDANVVRT